MIPAVVLLAALARLVVDAPGRTSAVIAYVVPAVLLAALAGGYWVKNFVNSRARVRHASAVRWLSENTRPNDPVVVWGAELGVLIAADRRPTGPYVYAYPLLKAGYGPAATSAATSPRLPPTRRER